ncbi:hypothetical protein CYMTET_41213 [Cymbomonas tetramitiformis]|uniref:Uncharacterized protein n=1 Tax=Cymbomonas tetramitiformis TaxID=36881 RepID=A0AAE0F3V7_9CHLO|nr:hypothetical protein CYMTET_41213 [Cymbomonas tetramitiformis]
MIPPRPVVQLEPLKATELCQQYKEAHGVLADGYLEDPCVVKLDRADCMKQEVDLSKEAKLWLEEYAPAIRCGPEYVREGEEGYGGICLELAAACWVMPWLFESEAKLVNTLKDVCVHESEAKLVTTLKDVVGEVLYELFGLGGVLRRFTLRDAAPLEGDIFSVHKLREELQAAVLCEKLPERSLFRGRPKERTRLLPVCEQLYRMLGQPTSGCWAQWRPLGGLVHGDLNGANVLIDIRGAVWLIDFAKLRKGHVLKDIAKLICCLWLEYTRLPLGVNDGREATDPKELGLWLGCDTADVEEVWQACRASQGTAAVCPSVRKLTEGRPGSHRWCGSEKEKEQTTGAVEALTEAFFGEKAPTSLHDEPVPMQPTELATASLRRSFQNVHTRTCELWRYARAMVSSDGKGQELDAHAMALWVPLLCEALKLLKYQDCSPQQKVWAARLAKQLAERVVGALQMDRSACRQAAGENVSRKVEFGLRLQPGARGWLGDAPVVLGGWDAASGKHTVGGEGGGQALDLDEAVMNGDWIPDARFAHNPIPDTLPVGLLEESRSSEQWRMTVEEAVKKAQQDHLTHPHPAAVDGLHVMLDADLDDDDDDDLDDDDDALRKGGEGTWELSVKIGNLAPKERYEDRREVQLEAISTDKLVKWRIKSCLNIALTEHPGGKRWLFVPAMQYRGDAQMVLRKQRSEVAGADALPEEQIIEVPLRGLCVAVMYSKGQHVWVLDRSASEAEAAPTTTLWREGVVEGVSADGGPGHFEIRFGKELRRLELKRGNHHVAPSVSYDVGTALVVCFADRIWRNAKVHERQGVDDATAVHVSGGDTKQVILNSFNHAVAMLPMSDFNKSWKWYTAKVRVEHGAIVDVLSGQRLDIKEHLVRITVVTRAMHSGQLEWNDKLQENDSEAADVEGSGGDGEGSTEFDVGHMFSPSPMRHIGEHSPHCYVLIAGAAMGKTTLLKRVMVECAGDGASEFLPILVLALDWASKLRAGLVTGDGYNLLSAYLRVLHGATSRTFLLLQQALSMRRALILVDGMDEAGEQKPVLERYLFSRLAVEGHRLVITSRQGGLSQQQVLLRGDTFLQLRPLSEEQQWEMVRRRLRGLCSGDASALLFPLHEHRGISGNPLMLSLLISVYKHGGGRYPATAFEIYQLAVQAMVEHVERKNRSQSSALALCSSRESPGALRMLTLLAYHHQVQRRRDITRRSITKAFEVLSPTYKEVGLLGSQWDWDKAWEPLQAMCLEGRMALLPCVSQDDGRGGGWELRFAHLTFQEYLCSKYLVGVLRGAASARAAPIPALKELVGLPWWDRTMRFCQEQIGYDSYDLLLAHEAGVLRMEDPQGIEWGLSHILPQLVRHSLELRELHLGGGHIGLDGAKALAAALSPNEQGVFNRSLNTLTITDGASLPIGALRRNELMELDLSGKRLTSEDAIILGVLLVSNTSLNTLDLRWNDIGPEGAKALAVALTPNAEGVFNGSLNTLVIAGNELCGLSYDGEGTYGASGIKALAEALVFNTSLNTLILWGNKIGPEGAKALAVALTPSEEGVFNTSLNTITITSGVGLPIGALRRNELTELDFGGKGLGPGDAIILGAVLVFNGSLSTLSLSSNNIGPKGAKALAVALAPNAEGVSNTSLNTLDLRCNDIGPEGAKALAVALTPNAEGVFNRSLNTLNLRCNNIGTEGAKALAVALTPNAEGVFNTSLNALNVWGNAMQLEGARALADAVKQRGAPVKLCGSLLDVEELNLHNVGLGPEDALLMANDLVFNGSLNTLSLSSNNIGPKGAKALAVALTPNAEGVFNGSLNTLDLRCNNIGPEGAKALAVALTPNAEGVFNGSLNTLTITDGVSLPIGALRRNELTELDLSGKRLRPEDAIILGALLVSNTSLNTLDLRWNDIGPEGAKALAVALTPNAEGVFNGSLSTLDLGRNQLCGVDFNGDGTYDASGIKALADALAFNTSLSTLSLSTNNIGPKGAKALAVALTPNAEDAIILGALLVLNTLLNTLDLSSNNIGPEGAKALAVALTPNAEGVFNGSLNTLTITDGVSLPIGALRRNELTELDLSGKRLRPEDAIILGALLVLNTSLNFLDLSSNQLSGVRNDMFGDTEGTYDASGIKALADALAVNKSLSMLDVRGNAISGEPAQQLAQGVLDHPSMKVFNKVAMMGMKADALTELDLSGKEIGVPGAIMLSKLLVFNKSLSTLNLGLNEIGDEGAKALAAALTSNEHSGVNGSLNTLKLFYNKIGPEGAKALAVALTPNEQGVFNGSWSTLDLKCKNPRRILPI